MKKYLYLGALAIVLTAESQAHEMSTVTGRLSAYFTSWSSTEFEKFVDISLPGATNIQRMMIIQAKEGRVSIDEAFSFREGDRFHYLITSSEDSNDVQEGVCEGEISLQNKDKQPLEAIRLKFDRIKSKGELGSPPWFKCKVLPKYQGSESPI